ncbi:MAG: hypothetical protein DCC68_01765 [Planctomycetota bacterium]|nr:MAG: hypothetical protein DCC68_01765 [Planctomycetota bacterium]
MVWLSGFRSQDSGFGSQGSAYILANDSRTSNESFAVLHVALDASVQFHRTPVEYVVTRREKA